ncbi:RP29 [Hepatospora eriocheir]|uniref:RP29 n=1 Tax=Hepatospora eriocheir TaxID=1081669 RepID=A0A1X0QCT9_9MICR|nr:RP29 [Hepatospora eriocheir]
MKDKPIDYFKSKIPNINHKLTIHMGTGKSILTPKKKLEMRVNHINPESITLDKIKEMNIEFNKYLDKLNINKLFIERLYKAELAGAKIFLRDYSNPTKLIECYIIGERENSLIVLEWKVKIYPKSRIEFYLIYQNIKYLFIGENLKLNRFFKS